MRQPCVYDDFLAALGSADSVQGHIITLEITSGEVYRGKLLEGAQILVVIILRLPC
jgi:hypothetical protein